MLSQPIYPQDLNENPHWYALHVRSRHEKKVHERMAAKGIESYLPLQKSLRQWSDRKKWVEAPLFRNYVFTRIALKNRLPVLQTDGAIRLVAFKGIPARIPDRQIEAIKAALEINPSPEVIDSFISGQEVEVIHGPFSGLRGVVQNEKGIYRVYISIEAISRSLCLEIDKSDVKKLV